MILSGPSAFQHQNGIQLPKKAGRAGVLVIHSWWGRTSSIVEFSSALVREGFAVAVADLFDGQIANTEAEARALRKRPGRKPMYRHLEANLSALREAIQSDQPKIGVVGFSMGGHWAIWLSQKPEYEISATVLYYAARAGDFSCCQSQFIAHFAENDPWVSPKTRRNMETAILRAGCPYQPFDYPGTGHWFAECGRHEEFQAESAVLAFERTIRHLRNTLA
mgnify:CR=1 FL=1